MQANTKNEKWLHKWGYADTEFAINPNDHSVVLTGNRYNLCGYKMPDFIPFIEHTLSVKYKKGEYLEENAIKVISKPNLNEAFCQEFYHHFPKSQYSLDDKIRLAHSHGQTSADEVHRVLYAQLANQLVDLVFYPLTEADVEAVINLASKHNICLIPYGGGTSVTNALKIPDGENRMVISVDMGRMNKIEWIDKNNMRACVQSGITGLELEQLLDKEGLILGHEPDSVEFSTLGGWIATNASGMKKNRYGNIEDIVENFTLISPKGRYEMLDSFPRLSMGMNPIKLLIGNEGNLGIITKAVIKVRPKPQCRKYQAIIFPDFAKGAAFLNELYRTMPLPASIRLMDNVQFKWGQALSPELAPMQKMIKGLEKKILKLKGIDFNKMVAATMLFEGDKKEITQLEKRIVDLAKRYKGIKAGEANGKRGYNLTFAIAYIRELIFKLFLLGETFETTVPWDKINTVYNEVLKHAYKMHREYNLPGTPLICARITQLYSSGVCMYFTYCIYTKDVENGHAVFSEIEHSFRDVILANGGSISHHHGIGKLRKDFMPEVLSKDSIQLIHDLKHSMDPQNIFGLKNNVMGL